MKTTIEQQIIITKSAEYLGVWLEAFLIDRRSQNLSKHSLKVLPCQSGDVLPLL